MGFKATCPKQLKEAIDFVKKKYTDPNDEIIAILPDKIGYQYFAVTFKKVENGMATSTIFSFEFEYWSEAEVDDGPVKCTRVEPMDFLI